MGFDIAMEFFVYRHLRALYERIAHMALTDDLIRLIKTPRLDASWQEWEAWYDRIAQMNADYDRLSEPIGIIRAQAKSELLVPDGAPMPKKYTRDNGITLNVSNEGTIIGGSPIGTDHFIKSYVTDKVVKSEEVMEIVKEFGVTEPQMASRLLEGSVNKGLDYILITTPERPIQSEIARFDRGIGTTFLRLLNPDGAEPDTSQERLTRACELAQLPHRNGGGNLTTAAIKSAPAFIANLYRSSHYIYVRGRLGSLRDEVEFAYNKLLTSLHVNCFKPGHPISSIIPEDVDQILDGTFANSFINNNNHSRVQGTIVEAIQALQWSEIRDDAVRMGEMPGHTRDQQSTASHILAITSKSQLTRVFTSNLGDPRCRIPAVKFVPWARWWFGLPQLTTIANFQTHSGHDYTMDVCKCDHKGSPLQGQGLDANGDHACSCPAAHRARNRTHNNCVWTIASAARDAGYQVTVEPAMSEVLVGQLTPAQCAQAFPDLSTKSLRLRAERMAQLNRQIREHTGSVEVYVKLLSKRDVYVAELMREGKALRFDISMTTPDMKQTSLVDFASVHITQVAYGAHTFKFFKEEHARMGPRVLLAGSAKNLFNDRTASGPVIQSARRKRIKYAEPVKKALGQFDRHERPDRPTFFPCIYSHRGEMGGGLFSLVEMMSMAVKAAYARKGERAWLDPKLASAMFRSRLKDRLATTMAIGWAGQLRDAGQLKNFKRNNHKSPAAGSVDSPIFMNEEEKEVVAEVSVFVPASVPVDTVAPVQVPLRQPSAIECEMNASEEMSVLESMIILSTKAVALPS
jgi:hypothetical protein